MHTRVRMSHWMQPHVAGQGLLTTGRAACVRESGPAWLFSRLRQEMSTHTGLSFGVNVSREDTSSLCPRGPQASREPRRGGWEPPFQGCRFHMTPHFRYTLDSSLYLCLTAPHPQLLWINFPKETCLCSCCRSAPITTAPSEGPGASNSRSSAAATASHACCPALCWHYLLCQLTLSHSIRASKISWHL